jgi:ADP-ribose pyrophosphatase
VTEVLIWKCLDEVSGSAGFLRVNTRRYLMPDGRTSDWDILRGGRTVATVAITTDDEVVLVRQFRPGPARILLELPGGNVAEDEEVLAACGRELLEETGYEAGTLTLVGRTWLASYATHERYAVLATGCRLTAAPRFDRDEFCETALVTRADFLAHVRTGELTDTDIAYMCLDRLGSLAQ